MFPKFRDYQHYSSLNVLQTADTYTIPFENFDGTNKYWINVWSYSYGDPPAFFFPEMIYNDPSSNDLRSKCPISCQMNAASALSFEK